MIAATVGLAHGRIKPRRALGFALVIAGLCLLIAQLLGIVQ